MKYQRSILEISGTIEVKGNATFGQGSRICVLNSGRLVIGENFLGQAGGTIICGGIISIGNNVLTSWDTLIMDTDFHQTIDINTGTKNEKTGSISIGDGVWICARSVVLKNAIIPLGCIVGCQSVVNKRFSKPNCLLVGSPSEIKKVNITKY